MGTADSFAVLGATTVTNTGPTTITGDLGVSPGTAITGSNSLTLHGSVHATDAVAAQAQADLTIAYNDAAGRAADATSPGDITGQVLSPGVYKSTSSLDLTGDVTLDGNGDPSSVFIFQIASTLVTASSSHVVLAHNAQSCNIFWQVGSSATLGTDSVFKGSILALASVTLNTGATVDGRAMARNAAVTMDSNTITREGCTTTSATTAGTPGATTGGAASGTGGTTGIGTTAGGATGNGATGNGATSNGTTSNGTTSALTPRLRTSGSTGRSTTNTTRLPVTGAPQWTVAAAFTALGLILAGSLLAVPDALRKRRIAPESRRSLRPPG